MVACIIAIGMRPIDFAIDTKRYFAMIAIQFAKSVFMNVAVSIYHWFVLQSYSLVSYFVRPYVWSVVRHHLFMEYVITVVTEVRLILDTVDVCFFSSTYITLLSVVI